MKKYLFIVLLVGFWGCEDKNQQEDEDQLNEESQSTYHFDLIYEDTGITKDENDYFHLSIDRDNWQTLYRVRGMVYNNNQQAEFMKFNWQSNLYCKLGDTLWYYIHTGLTDDL